MSGRALMFARQAARQARYASAGRVVRPGALRTVPCARMSKKVPQFHPESLQDTYENIEVIKRIVSITAQEIINPRLSQLVTKEYLKEELDARFKEVDARFKGVDAKFDVMQEKMDARFKGVDAKFDAMQEKMDARFKGVDAKFDAMQEKMDARFKGVDAKFDAMQEKMDARFKVVDAKFDAMLEKISAGFKAVDARFDAQEKEQKKWQDNFRWWAKFSLGGGSALISLGLFSYRLGWLSGVSPADKEHDQDYISRTPMAHVTSHGEPKMSSPR